MAFEIARAGRFDWGVIAGNKEGFSLGHCTPYQQQERRKATPVSPLGGLSQSGTCGKPHWISLFITGRLPHSTWP